MSNLPICVILGAGGSDPDIIIQGILGGDLPSSSLHQDGLSLYRWDITNKYYHASIHLGKMEEKALVTEETAENINAVIVYFNSSEKEEALKSVNEWTSFIEPLDAEVKILVCDQCSLDEGSDRLSKIQAHQWCIKHGFELVELDPLETPDPDDDFPETLGMQRIVQALHAHSWPNLELKSGVEKSRIDHLSRLLLGEDPAADSSLDTSGGGLLDDATSSPDRQAASEGIDSFEELFQSMSLMKSQAESLQGAERKAYAEKVTMAFWKAIEGDPAEIEGLDSSADED